MRLICLFSASDDGGHIQPNLYVAWIDGDRRLARAYEEYITQSRTMEILEVVEDNDGPYAIETHTQRACDMWRNHLNIR
jgi:hypothetical protein